MIQDTIYNENITVIKFYEPNNRALKYIKQKVLESHRNIQTAQMYLKIFNTPLSVHNHKMVRKYSHIWFLLYVWVFYSIVWEKTKQQECEFCYFLVSVCLFCFQSGHLHLFLKHIFWDMWNEILEIKRMTLSYQKNKQTTFFFIVIKIFFSLWLKY